MGLVETAETGNRIESLRELRGILAAKIEGGAGARDLAALSKQFTSVLEQIAELDGAGGGGRETPLSVIQAKRAARLAENQQPHKTGRPK